MTEPLTLEDVERALGALPNRATRVKTEWVSEEEYCKSFTDRGETIPPFLAFAPYEVRDGVPGYWLPKQGGREDA